LPFIGLGRTATETKLQQRSGRKLVRFLLLTDISRAIYVACSASKGAE
jgi:hypothetical protein